MSHRFRCATCQGTLALSSQRAGTRLICPTCRIEVMVPNSPAFAVVDWRIVGGAGVMALLLVGYLIAALAHSLPEIHQVESASEERSAEPANSDSQPALTDNPSSVPDKFVEAIEPAAIVPTKKRSSPNENVSDRVANEPPADPAPAPPPAPAPEIKKPTPPEEFIVKRIRRLNDEELRRQLLSAPELNLDHVPYTSTRIVQTAARQAALYPQTRPQTHIVPSLLTKRADLNGLPMRMGVDCQIGKDSAEHLQALSRKLRGYIGESIPKGNSDPRPDPAVLRRKLLEGADGERREWQQAAAIPTLQQMLQAENTPLRLLLVELLTQIKDPAATTALAQRALFDLSSEVRTSAIQALDRRPREDYRDILLNGIQYPWPAVAEHAAESLVALKDKEAMPALLKLLNEPSPGALYFDSNQKVYMVREMVRINHFGNCLLCHAPSTHSSDLVRGIVPEPGQPLPPPTTGQYYEGDRGSFVRADVTYLKQDFSVPQPVEKPGKWPTMQRYDYLVRTRPATLADQQRMPNTQREEAIRFALMKLNKV